MKNLNRVAFALLIAACGLNALQATHLYLMRNELAKLREAFAYTTGELQTYQKNCSLDSGKRDDNFLGILPTPEEAEL